MSGLRDFLNDYFNFRNMAREKRKFRQMQNRAKALPGEYTYVFNKIQHYMWMHSGGSGMDMLPIFTDLLDLFETGAAEGKRVLEVTGEDVAEFCDELLRNARTYTQKWRDDLNRDIRNKVGRGRGSK
jgi:DNA-binding ferritin-like protein (Dps family)